MTKQDHHAAVPCSEVFLPAHNLIRPQPRSSLPYRRRIHNLVVHQRRSPLPCRRSIFLRRSASLHRSRTAAPGRARGLALLRNLQGCQRGLSVFFFFLSGFSFLSCFSSFSSRHLVFVFKKVRRPLRTTFWLQYRYWQIIFFLPFYGSVPSRCAERKVHVHRCLS